MKMSTFFVVPNLEKIGTAECTPDACAVLLQHGSTLYMAKAMQEVLPIAGVKYVAAETALAKCDAIICIGGDGTVVHQAKHALQHDKPLIGINTGRLGYLAQIEPDELDMLEKLCTGEFSIQKRLVLDVCICSQYDKKHYIAVNDAVVSNGTVSKILDLDVYTGEELVTSYRADGIIVSTPTGSTAYALSAGGPIIDPTIRTLQLTPISPHSLFSRPILFSQNDALTIRPISRGGDMYVTIDGERSVQLQNADAVVVKAAKKKLQFIMLSDREFFKVLKTKFIGRWR